MLRETRGQSPINNYRLTIVAPPELVRLGGSNTINISRLWRSGPNMMRVQIQVRPNNLAAQRQRRVMSIDHDPNHNTSSGGAIYEYLSLREAAYNRRSYKNDISHRQRGDTRSELFPALQKQRRASARMIGASENSSTAHL
jgi:hypothetical protein